jgi:hypothetical protein
MHADPELLALLALGESAGTEQEHAHVQTCPECAGELSELHRVTALGRTLGSDTTMEAPSLDVWARISDELGFDLVPDAPTAAATPASSVLPGHPEPAWSVNATPTSGTVAKHVRRPLLDLIKTALAGPLRGSRHELTAQAQLTPVDSIWSHASGKAQIATDEHGRRVLQVDLEADLPTSGVRQAWLIHRDDPTQRQTLGILDGPHGLWTIDHSIDLESYGILDISQQGAGEVEHSGQTIVRGDLALVS